MVSGPAFFFNRLRTREVVGTDLATLATGALSALITAFIPLIYDFSQSE